MGKAPWSNLGLRVWSWVRIQLWSNFFYNYFLTFLIFDYEKQQVTVFMQYIASAAY